MRTRGYLGWATTLVAWGVAACALSAAPGCGDDGGSISQSQVEQSSPDALRDSLKYSQALHEKKGSSKKSSRR